MRFMFMVEAETDRIEGKFASRDEIGGQISEAIESADPGSIDTDEGAQYETTSWEVSEETSEPQARKILRQAQKERRAAEEALAEMQKIIEQGGLEKVWIVADEEGITRHRSDGHITGLRHVYGIYLSEKAARAEADSSMWDGVHVVELEVAT
jgi:hypothetical protein